MWSTRGMMWMQRLRGRSVVVTLALASGLVPGCGDDKSGSGSATMTSTATMTAGTTSGGSDATASGGATDGGSGVTGGATGGTTGGGAGEAYCQHHCGADADCKVGGMDLGLVCKDTQCQGTAPGCTGSEECVALFSGWNSPCTAGGMECEPMGQVCVKVPSGAACATPPSDVFMCDSVPNWAEIQAEDVDGNPVTVCGNPGVECGADGICFSPCKSDADCFDGFPICEVSTGLCRCGTDADCAKNGAPNLSVCLPSGLCGCNEDQQCVDAKSGDVCTSAGFCGCSGDAGCADVDLGYDGGAIMCQK